MYLSLTWEVIFETVQWIILKSQIPVFSFIKNKLNQCSVKIESIILKKVLFGTVH